MRVALFVEDIAQANLIGSLLRRVARESGVPVEMVIRNADGGEGRVWTSLRRYVADLASQLESADALVVAVDANKVGVAARRKRAREVVDEVVDLVLAIPAPYIEKWYLLDFAALGAAVGAPVASVAAATEARRDLKAALRNAISSATGLRPPPGRSGVRRGLG